MIQLSKFPVKTLKSTPKVSDNISTGYLLQGGFIRQEMAGAYNYLPFGLKVLKKIEEIVRQEMNAIGAQEILMPSLGSYEHWTQTGRWDTVDVLFKLPASTGKEYALNPTHEELVTPLMQEFIQSYKDLEFGVYQIQTKFRNEKRAKSGILRGREFIMKDLYSFHKSEETLVEYYEMVKNAYVRVYERLGLGKDTYVTLASGGDFTTLNSHEFQTILPIGEDNIYICGDCNTSHNEEIIDTNNFTCANCKSHNYRVEKASEVGNIFPLMTKFSDAFGVKYTSSQGKEEKVFMGCYGIGISRLMGVIAEYFMDDKGLVWPENIAPATHYIIVMGNNLQKALELAKKIESEGGEAIIDDREKIGFGQKASDADLLGITNRIVISDKTLELNSYELKKRNSENTELIKF